MVTHGATREGPIQEVSAVTILDRLASAPISWGVCEVPGWGLELPRQRVLAEMAELGLVGTELGPNGYLPDDAGALRALLDHHHLALVGGFVPLVLHDADQREATLKLARRAAARLSGAGGSEFITAAVTSPDWERRRTLTPVEWAHVMAMLAELDHLVADHGLCQVLHPHVGTIVERDDEVRRVLEQSDVHWCLDTAHLAIGGYDPVEFLHDAGDRVHHVHLKDVHLEVAQRILAGELTLMQGVQQDVFCPMGRGDVAINQMVTSLERAGYDRWYVLEQDTSLTAGEPPAGSGPMIDVLESVEYVRNIDVDLRRPSGVPQ